MNERTVEERLASIEANLGLIAKTVRDIAMFLGVRDRIREDLDELERVNGHDTEPAPGPEGEAA
jgi:hypothetical protein